VSNSDAFCRNRRTVNGFSDGTILIKVLVTKDEPNHLLTGLEGYEGIASYK
jgi:hypothetical protein